MTSVVWSEDFSWWPQCQ